MYILITVAVASTVLSSPCSTVNRLSQRSSITPVIASPSMEYSQQSILSQPSSCVTLLSDTHTTFSSSPVATLSVVECLTTSSSVITCISGQIISTVTTTAGRCTIVIYVMYQIACVSKYSYVCMYVRTYVAIYIRMYLHIYACTYVHKCFWKLSVVKLV